jgi:hydroxymethylglutaryl-CoA lyase
MSDLPKFVRINEEGPREGFQYEKGPIPTARKIELVDRLSDTGLQQIQVVSYVNPERVPGMADADAVVAGMRKKPGVRYTALWLNDKGLRRAIASGKIDVRGTVSLTASEKFLQRNQRRTLQENLQAQSEIMDMYVDNGVPIDRVSVMAAFGCNFEGDIAPRDVLALAQQGFELAQARGLDVKVLSLADTMGWATPAAVKKVVGAVREWRPDLELSLHLHDTRGMGIANAFAGMEMGVAIFDATVGGLGGCPFAGNAAAAGNVCSEDLAFLCQEIGVETGIDLDALVDCAILAEDIVGHPLPGSVKVGGTLRRLRDSVRKAA